MIVADASVIIAALSPSEPAHAWALALLRDAQRVVVHPITCAEVLVGPARRSADLAASLDADLCDLAVDHGSVAVPPYELALVRAESGLRMPDACVLATAESLDLPLATLDQRLADASRARGVEVLPTG
ncbi:MAG TPA: type II toxin-antitoxin system VapC family toxin [Actinomycetales bacterium]|nr:type II toxin-antitoxin system VapC family toxin [Actinomycetales bacterium]